MTTRTRTTTTNRTIAKFMTSGKTPVRRFICFRSQTPQQSKTVDWPLPGLQVNSGRQEFHPLLLLFILVGDNGFTVPHQTVQLEVKGRVIVDGEPIRSRQWIWTSQKTARLLEAPSYWLFLLSVPVDMVCDVIQWAWIQEMGWWYEEDILISMDLDNVY